MIKFALMEKQYKDFSPEIDYNEELPVESKETTGENKPHKTKDNSKTPSAKATRKLKEEKKKPVRNDISIKETVKKWANGQSIRLITGIFLGCLSIYFLVSFLSYIGTCVHDQSLINSTAIGSAGKVANAGGEGGARLSEYLINEGFGAGSFVIILWLGAMSLKLLTGRPKFKSVNFTIKCLVALLTVSLIIGLTTIWAHSAVNWGGYHARYVYQFIENFTGTTGSVLLCIFMVALFTVICLRDMINWLQRKHEARMARKRAEEELRRAEEEERRRKEEELLQEKLDDVAAGESEIPSSLKVESEENIGEKEMTFTDDDYPEEDERPLYTLDTYDDEIGTSETRNSFGVDQPHHIDDRDKVEIDSEETDQDLSASASAGELHPDGDSKDEESSDATAGDPMIVRVNQIGESEKRHFKSQKDFESHYPYKFPPFDLMREGQEKISVDAEEQMENQARIKQTLLDFGIPITDINATVGPTVTLYEIVPDKGVKIAKIRSLVDDIALSLSATGVRIIAPIPGKGTVGIEVANKDPLTVSMRTIIKSKRYQESKYILPVALGSTISNDVYIADLAKMPHLLVAGATGQGKSVGLNAIITSLLYCKSPTDLKFVMIDPKQVEFSIYNKIKNHYMAVIPEEADSEEPVITDMKKVEATLNSLCIEMDNRYTLLKNALARNIEEYNTKIKEGKLNPNEGHHYLPYIVVVVDEFGDLIMVSGKNVEMPIARLAQKARAVGMHVIIATQRPSANVITGIIKANFPARVSFKVSSGVDSKTILDTSGAQHLIGRGDMLIFNNSEMVRVQCAFIDTPEVEQICEYIGKQPYPTGVYLLPEPEVSTSEGGNSGGMDIGMTAQKDPLLEDVARKVVASGTASTSNIQRLFRIGYNRAGSIMDQLEVLGIVGAAQGGKPRQVLVDLAGLEAILNSI